MNILFITETFPYPLDSGGKIVSYQTLQMLSVKHHIYLLSFAHIMPNKFALKAIQSLGVKIRIVLSEKRSERYKQPISELTSSLLRLQPFYLSLFYSNEFYNTMRAILTRYKIDVIHIDHLGLAQYLPKVKKQQWVLFEHNIEHSLSKQLSNISGISIKEKIFHYYNFITLLRYEKRISRMMDQVITLSRSDAKELASLRVDVNKILVVPPYYVPKPYPLRRPKKELLFIGNLWWKPNYDAITWFLQKSFPILRRLDPNVSLTIIGDRGRCKLPVAQNDVSIHVLGKQKTLQYYLKRSGIFILPFRCGGGVRIKALTAFASAIPVVSTTIGMQGINAKNNVHFLLADSPLSFAKTIYNLFRSPTMQNKLKNNALRFIKKYYNRKNIQNHLLKNYAKIQR